MKGFQERKVNVGHGANSSTIFQTIFLAAFLGLPAAAQIVQNPDGSITGTADRLSCTISNPTAGTVLIGCSHDGVPYANINWLLNNGADASGYEVRDGNAVNFSSSMVNGVISWFLSVQPNGGVVTRQNGVFPPFVGTNVLGICQIQGTGLMVDGSNIFLNETVATCLDPV